MNTRNLCMCILAVVAIGAMILLLYISGAFTATGAVSTGICPRESAPIISGEEFMSELSDFERQGHYCFFGYDGVTPCCVRR